MKLLSLRRTTVVAVTAAVALALGVTVAVARQATDEALPAGAPATTVTTAPPSTAPSSTAPPSTAPPSTGAPVTTAPTTTTTAPPAPPSYRTGDEGPEIQQLQAQLLELGFWVPAADGRYGSLTAQAVMAFQKANGLARDGVAGPATLAAVASAVPTTAREGGDHVEIDLERQILIVVRGGQTRVFNTSTGRSGWRTRPGRFTVDRQIDGVRHAPLGDLYRPKYFDGGIAIHGSPSIPGQPASHGCARVHDEVMDLLWDGLVPKGTPVWVY